MEATSRRFVVLLVMASFHALAVFIAATLLALPFIGSMTASAFLAAGQISGFRYLLGQEVLIHLGVSAALWASLYLSWQAFIQTRRSGARKQRRAIKLSRGTVLTETLIVMPVVLMLIFGLAQLAVLNVAAVLSNVAVVNAARTVWIWLPETSPIGQEKGRGDISQDHVRELARVQAAAALTPVAPSDFRLSSGAGTNVFHQMRGSFVASQLEWLPNDAGRMGMLQAFLLADASGENAGDDLSFYQAMDKTSFRVRTARKFTSAYIATEVEVLDRGDWVGARVTYKQFNAFPLTGRLFGDAETVGQRTGYFTTLVREFDLKRQLEPNARFPRRSR